MTLRQIVSKRRPPFRGPEVWTRGFLILCVMVLAACGDGSPDIPVLLDGGSTTPVRSAQEEATGDTLEPLRFVYASVLSPERSVLAYARLGRYMSSQLGREVVIVRRKTYGELNELLRTGQAEAGLVCTGAFAAGEDGFGLEAIAIPVIEGRRTYRSYVIARRGSGLTSFTSLAGRSFAFTDPLSNTGYRYVTARLLDEGTDPERYFPSVVFTYGHDNSIEAVRDGIVDAGSIDSLVWDELVRRDPTLEHDVVVVDRSPEFPINPVALAPNQPSELGEAIAGVFLSMDQDEEGREILFELGTDMFVSPTVETLEGYDAIARSWRRLEGASRAASEGAAR